MKKLFRLPDLIIILLIAAVCLTFFLIPKKEGRYLIIEKSGEEIRKLDLSSYKTPEKITIETTEGDLIIEVGENYARIKSSPCKNKLCVRCGKIEKSGETVVCLPCEVSIRLSGETEYDGRTG